MCKMCVCHCSSPCLINMLTQIKTQCVLIDVLNLPLRLKTLQHHLAAKYVSCSFNSFNKCSVSLALCSQQSNTSSMFILIRLIVLYIHMSQVKILSRNRIKQVASQLLFLLSLSLWSHLSTQVYCLRAHLLQHFLPSQSDLQCGQRAAEQTVSSWASKLFNLDSAPTSQATVIKEQCADQ